MKSLKKWEVAGFAKKQGVSRQVIENRIKAGWKFGHMNGDKVMYSPTSVIKVKGDVMKIKLLNDGGYAGLESVDFPVEVETENSYVDIKDILFFVNKGELLRVGADKSLSLNGLVFAVGDDCQVVKGEG